MLFPPDSYNNVCGIGRPLVTRDQSQMEVNVGANESGNIAAKTYSGSCF
jgi:hypothetical protein